MRKKLSKEEKRSEHIGIKVKIKTKEQLERIAEIEDRPLSTQIDIILTAYIEDYFKNNKWANYSPQEKGGE